MSKQNVTNHLFILKSRAFNFSKFSGQKFLSSPFIPKNHTSIIGNSRHYSSKHNKELLNILKIMPKEPKHIAEAQKQRRKIKEKLSRYVPGKVTLQVLGTGAKGAPRALYLFSDQTRYLFNCGEGTQRLAHEHKMKLAKLEHIFITQSAWRNMGGLPGTALTIQDVGVPEITLHGPPGLGEIFVATKRFVVIRDLKINMADCSEQNVFEDNVLRVEYVHLMKSDVISDPQPEDTFGFKDSEVEATVQQEDASTSTRSEKNRRRRRSSSRSTSSDKAIEDDTDYYAHERKRFSKSKRRRSRSLSIESGSRTVPEIVSPTSQATLRLNKEMGVSVAYICRLQPRPGALNLEQCVKMGVPPGPLLGRLKAGEDVVLASGVKVCSREVCEPDDPGPVFIVLECPTVAYLDSLLNNAAMKKHQSSATHDDEVACVVVHFTPKEVCDDARYRQWMDKFSPSTRHIMLNESNSCMGSEAVHRIQYKLNLLSDSIFPLLKDKGTNVAEEISDNPSNKKQKCEEKNGHANPHSSLQNDLNFENLTVQSRPATPDSLFISPKTICTYQLRPRKGLDRTAEIKINPKEYINETMAVENFPTALTDLKDKLIDEKKKLHNSEYPKILFLGTGSCIPNKTRNTSGILFSTNDRQHIVLDCGEGTYGQIVRFFGPSESDRVLANIEAIYVSHLHADHHIGLTGLLQGRRKAIRNQRLRDKGPLYLFAPKQIMAWLSFYDKCFEDITEEFVLIPNGDLVYNNPVYPADMMKPILSELNLSDLKTCFVRHCPNAFGVSLVDKHGIKLTYSGDTMPADSLIELGANSDVLIHEATMEDELAQEAVVKMHSTTSQAIEVGRKMAAKHVILTHFSQRYAKLPRYNDNFSENVGIAFDNMQVNMNDLVLVPHLRPALKLMFAEHYEDIENKAMKRNMRLEREKSALSDKNLKRKQSVT